MRKILIPYVFALLASAPVSSALAQWLPCPTGSSADLHAVLFIRPSVGLALGDKGTILRTTTGGITWTAVTSGTGASLKAVVQAPGGALYAVGNVGALLRSEDNGKTWQALTSGTMHHLKAIHFPTASTGYAVGSGGTILKTMNRGRTWQPQSSGVSGRLDGVFFPTPQVGYCVQSGTAHYLKTGDAGRTWVVHTLPAAFDASLSGKLLFRNAHTGFLLGGDQRMNPDERVAAVYATTDGGATWQQRQVLGTASVAIGFTSTSTGYLLVDNFQRAFVLRPPTNEDGDEPIKDYVNWY